MGTLFVVATPIGNLEDITIRAIKVLLSTPVIACEDTRRTGQLIKILEIKYKFLADCSQKKFISVRDWNEKEQIEKILSELMFNDIALVSDAGTPLISDPGFKIVRSVRDAGFKIVPIPGPSAITAALCASGLPTNKFTFYGFDNKLEFEKKETSILYESAKRINDTIAKIREKYPEAQIIIAREMTKIYEYIGPDDGLTKKGEVTILIYLPKEEDSGHP